MFDSRKTAADLLGMAKVLIGKDADFNPRKTASTLLRMAKELIAADGWEAPRGNRKEWRKRKPDGSYEYRYTPPEGKAPPPQQDKSKVVQSPKKDQGDKSKPEKRRIQYKLYIKLDKPKLQETLTKGHYSLISAGKNGDDPKEAGMSPDDEFFHKRHEELRGELEKAGFSYTEVVGHYGGKEDTFLVFHDDTELTPKTQKSIMVHHADAKESKKRRSFLEDLGKKYNQNSVLHAGEGRNDMVFTTGSKAGKTCGGNGWKEAPDATDYYTDIELKSKKHTKFQLDIHECKERGLL
jgi:hypothetical protein